MDTLTSSEAADRLGVSYRQLDYFARTVIEPADPAALGACGSGSRRRWPADLVARLEVAAVLAQAAGCDWGTMARTVYEATSGPADEGWVLLDGLGDVTFAQSADDIAAALVASGGGLVARYTVAPDRELAAA